MRKYRLNRDSLAITIAGISSIWGIFVIAFFIACIIHEEYYLLLIIPATSIIVFLILFSHRNILLAHLYISSFGVEVRLRNKTFKKLAWEEIRFVRCYQFGFADTVNVIFSGVTEEEFIMERYGGIRPIFSEQWPQDAEGWFIRFQIKQKIKDSLLEFCTNEKLAEMISDLPVKASEWEGFEKKHPKPWESD